MDNNSVLQNCFLVGVSPCGNNHVGWLVGWLVGHSIVFYDVISTAGYM
jgi:hypothetical protein